MSNISTLKKKKYIRLYNPITSQIAIPLYSRDNRDPRGCIINGSKDGQPGYVDVKWEDLYFINDRTDVFRNGAIRFQKEDEEALYNELGITDWRDILTEDDLEDIILHPTMESLQRIIDLKDIYTIERARGKLLYLLNTGANVSTRSMDVINGRFQEFNKGKRVSNITLVPREVVKPADEKEVATLKNEIAELKAMVEAMTKA